MRMIKTPKIADECFLFGYQLREVRIDKNEAEYPTRIKDMRIMKTS